ncbi:MAG: hypothetical protein ACRDDY_13900 [Clostridium sp.]|uniref:hypothetical protein n=1 Tax=Clostridium sp. TaxID=1506 RepID=UPI003EE64AD2
MDATVALKEAYSSYIGSDLGSYQVGRGESEKYDGKTLLDVRLENYRRLCVKEFLNISFPEYIANPRWVICKYDAMCTKWSAATPVIPGSGII